MPQVVTARNLLAANEKIAGEIRRTLATLQVHMLNLMGAPGAGKTALLEQSIERLRGKLAFGVIAGDCAGGVDAARLEAVGARTVQINTQGRGHLEAYMVLDALERLDLAHVDMLVIENVGNLICPATWTLGEDQRVVVMDVAQGDDTPTKYPGMFAATQGVVVSKLDLLPYVDCDLEKVRRLMDEINLRLRVFGVSCRTSVGLDEWCTWLVRIAHGETPGGTIRGQRHPGPDIVSSSC
ncbi:MAG TPA: hydrogenase nickel incorporation protein HypB [Ktedonobacteraceae bacterium]|jgi:hydrogenase nickel incorporation protein HypB